ncbi:hypothetical protein QR680_013690 [Steinernema hermaphroditum]|uniref:Uncharacterized protein n=1 Tax=Steinernema hermaphroditum TaxID=289476 RepID=A0AA39M2S9_9BILA|nr:hypothetical protein QR680_013690 [Steinernema hermaphroditum]
MRGFSSVIFVLVVPCIWTVDAQLGDPSKLSVVKLWESSKSLDDLIIVDRMIFEFEVTDPSLPLRLTVSVRGQERCERIRICEEKHPRNVSDLCSVNLLAKPWSDGILTFHLNGSFTLHRVRHSQMMNRGISLKEYGSGDHFNIKLIQNRTNCRAKLQVVEGSGAKLVSIQGVLRKMRRTGHNLWAFTISLVVGSFFGAVPVLICLLKCRYAWYCTFYETLYAVYRYNPDKEAREFHSIEVGSASRISSGSHSFVDSVIPSPNISTSEDGHARSLTSTAKSSWTEESPFIHERRYQSPTSN